LQKQNRLTDKLTDRMIECYFN